MDTNEPRLPASTPRARFMIGMLWGAAIGAGAALILAPRSGRELRGQVSDSVHRARVKARSTYYRASDTMSHVAERAAHVADDLAQRAAHMTAKLNSSMSRMS